MPAALAEAGNPITISNWALINSCFSVGGLIGSYGCVAPLAYLGRKKTLMLTNLFVFASAYFMFTGTTWYVLVLGRVCIGIVAGVAQMVAGAYMVEIAPLGIRGSVGVCSQVGIVIGIALANFLTAPSFELLGSPELWRYVFVVPALFSLMQLAVLPFCPESPAFLIKARGEEATWEVLTKLHRDQSAMRHMENLKLEIEEGSSKGGGKGDDMSVLELLSATHLRKQLLVGVIIKVGVQFSGIDAIFYYSTLMFRHANVPDPQLATTLLSVVNLTMTFVAMGIMEKAGRRALMMVTWVGMCTGFFVIYLAESCQDFFGMLRMPHVTSVCDPDVMSMSQVCERAEPRPRHS